MEVVKARLRDGELASMWIPGSTMPAIIGGWAKNRTSVVVVGSFSCGKILLGIMLHVAVVGRKEMWTIGADAAN